VTTNLAAGAMSTVLIAAAAWANWTDTSTGIDLASLPAFPLTKVRSGLLKEGEQVRFGGLVAKKSPPAGSTADEVILRGNGKSGKPWTVHFFWGAFAQVYRGDLDGNGTQDYVVFGGGIGNGRLFPLWTMTVLLMDRQGLPVPFEYALYDELGPRHVVDILHDGRAQLVLSDYDENSWDSNLCSGRWISNLYEAADLDWGKVRRSAAGLIFPLVHRWTYGPNCDPSSQPQLGNEQMEIEKDAAASADITSARIADVDPNSWLGGQIKLTLPSGCESISVGTVVYDQRSERTIALVSGSGYVKTLLGRIRADNAEVKVSGVHRYPVGRDCTANLLWASR